MALSTPTLYCLVLGWEMCENGHLTSNRIGFCFTAGVNNLTEWGFKDTTSSPIPSRKRLGPAPPLESYHGLMWGCWLWWSHSFEWASGGSGSVFSSRPVLCFFAPCELCHIWKRLFAWLMDFISPFICLSLCSNGCAYRCGSHLLPHSDTLWHSNTIHTYFR